MFRIRAPKDAAAGLLFIGFGAAAAAVGREYEMGTGLRMGPGYFPSVLALGLVLVGAIALGKALVIAGPPIGRIRWRPLVAVLGSLVAFGALLERLGLFVALAALVLVSRLAGKGHRFRETAGLALFLALFSYVVLVYALGLPVELWPWEGG